MRHLIRLQDIHQLSNLELIARQVVEGFIIGLHKSPFHGFSVEFAEHRIYNPGEAVKNIDWKVYGRTDRLYTKKFEEETNLRCQIVVDASSSMYFPDDISSAKVPANKIAFSIVCAAAMMNLLRKQRDAFGLSLFSDHVIEHTSARSTSIHYNLLMSHLEQLLAQPLREKTTAAADALHHIAENIHRRSLVVIFSDMMENATQSNALELDELFAALQHLRYNKHEVILFHVFDYKRELDFQYDNRPYLFVDLETNEKIRLHASQVKEHYQAHVTKFLSQLKLKCAQFQIDFVEADISKEFKQVLLPYLIKRMKMN
jgi:uncharacterized protein (DUF58 family)